MEQKKVLVLGGTGAMGVYVVPELLKLGYKVDVLSLNARESDNENLRYFQVANAKVEDTIRPFLEEGGYDGIVDFMLYTTKTFTTRHKLLLDNCKHYIYLSSYRVYADEQHPITESAPQLLDVSKDEEMLATDTYALAKSRQEDILENSSYNNWTAIRPAITFSKFRYQLVTLEAGVIIRRALAGKKVLLPEGAMKAQATMTWGADVAKMIVRLLFNEKAMREHYTVATAEHNTWETVASYYHDLIGLEYEVIPTDDFLRLVNPDDPFRGPRWQLEYDRMYDRIVDNSKMLEATGLKQSDFTSVRDALAIELAALPKDTVWPNDADLCDRMDKYIEEHNL